MNIIEERDESDGTSFSFQTRESCERETFLSFTHGNGVGVFLFAFVVHARSEKTSLFAHTFSISHDVYVPFGRQAPRLNSYIFISLRYLSTTSLPRRFDSLVLNRNSPGKKLRSCRSRFTFATFRHDNLISPYKSYVMRS